MPARLAKIMFYFTYSIYAFFMIAQLTFIVVAIFYLFSEFALWVIKKTMGVGVITGRYDKN